MGARSTADLAALRKQPESVWADHTADSYRDGWNDALDAVAAARPADGEEPEGRYRTDEANALGYREGYRLGRAAGIAEVVDAQGGQTFTPAQIAELARPADEGLNVERLAAAMNGNIEPRDVQLGRDLTVVAQRVAAAYGKRE